MNLKKNDIMPEVLALLIGKGKTSAEIEVFIKALWSQVYLRSLNELLKVGLDENHQPISYSREEAEKMAKEAADNAVEELRRLLRGRH